ncbi:cyclin-like protein interacting with PHO85 [Kickxella alabastrina]|uniref:Cyclin-like protein interacting with PHO85 n=1 Tax=Kickxella alabastrina TaxID=61397 RepID=A0ACC1IWF8_9FUNG|nr:cyclin-like protein interacting with PHO85 [Kickxella alabastrina]
MSDVTPFHCRAIPRIPVHAYLTRVQEFLCLGNDCLLATLVCVDRISRAQMLRPALAVSPMNIHRLLISAIVVAHKFNSDVFFNNARYAKVGGLPLAEMNQLELEFLFLIKFELKVDDSELELIGEWLMTESQIQYQAVHDTICVLDAYYESKAAISPNISNYHLQYPTPSMDPAAGAPVPPMQLNAHEGYPIPQASCKRQESTMSSEGTSMSNYQDLITPSSLGTIVTTPACHDVCDEQGGSWRESMAMPVSPENDVVSSSLGGMTRGEMMQTGDLFIGNAPVLASSAVALGTRPLRRGNND